MNTVRETCESIIRSRASLAGITRPPGRKMEEEGGCGVVGLLCTEPVKGKHIRKACEQMHNRGNGKGGGVAALGLSSRSTGVSPDELKQNYLIQVAFLDETVVGELEKKYIAPVFDVKERKLIPTLRNFREIESLEVKPPVIYRYFARVRPGVVDEFARKNNLGNADRGFVEDEIVHQNSFRLNSEYYASREGQRAFVLCHGKDIAVFKIVGYAEDALSYYLLDESEAHLWIGHQRYPTKGKVWHPGGAHPFIGLNEVLVHNGDFANYFSVSEYLRQRNIYPLFMTDTEVSVLLFDLWTRVYKYPLEYVIEALAPTTERDFHVLPEEKKQIYRSIQSSHIHGSPDGPWFFIVGRSLAGSRSLELLGITDTSMLRPQVFSMSTGEVSIGVIASEKQAIDITLKGLSEEDDRICGVADMYWNARGGSHTDGGAFVFRLSENGKGGKVLECVNKFNEPVKTQAGTQDGKPRETLDVRGTNLGNCIGDEALSFLSRNGAGEGSPFDVSDSSAILRLVRGENRDPAGSRGDDDFREESLSSLLRLGNLYYPRNMKRSRFRSIIDAEVEKLLRTAPPTGSSSQSRHRLLDWSTRDLLSAPHREDAVLFLDASLFPPDGEESLARMVVKCRAHGLRHLTIFGLRGQRFIGCGLGPSSNGFRIDVIGSSGDYLGSGLDGADMYVHGSAQDQLGQIFKSGTLVVFGDVGQTFMYGAKGGEAYVLGNAAGRPLINAVGCPRVVINGTCLDYLAEAFMAGDPLNGGGFVVVNGIRFDENGVPVSLDTPYPGGNLFSLASGGAIYLRDPRRMVEDDQLNGGRFARFTEKDWELILPYLTKNESLFGISIEDTLLKFDGRKLEPGEMYRKVEATVVSELMPEGE